MWKVLFISFFKNWNCIGIKENLDFSKPLPIRIGDLPLIIWKNKYTEEYMSAINVCKHMGSKLDNGNIMDNGCLQCPYHGLEITKKDTFGEVVEHEGKLFWAKDPIEKKPYSIPFYNNKDYVHSFLQIDMDCSLQDSVYNTMDVRHPEYVHNKIVGFGSNIPPKNLQQFKYKDNKRVGLKFDYESNQMMKNINDNVKTTHNFHMFIYPTFSWSRVSFDNKHLIIGVNLLPLTPKKTRWMITICHNYYKSKWGQEFIKMLALTILTQDYYQMINQYEENDLKKQMIFKKVFPNEEVILWLYEMFKNYSYPSIEECVKIIS
jgi:phenylpropionate dioxygenase-like ring-hydroxylating dioxygenase large terminal subunit